MGKVRKCRRLLRVVIASGLLVVALPSVATAHEHLDPVDALGGGRQAGATKARCSMDPRDPALMEPGVTLCHDYQVTTDRVPTGEVRAYVQHLVPPEVTARIDQAPEASDRTDFEIGWWLVAIALAAAGAAGLIVGLRRGRSHALSS
jgi:hypothetical protein